jgi:hypothetical protein
MYDSQEFQRQLEEEIERQRKEQEAKNAAQLQKTPAPQLQTDKTADVLNALSSLSSKQSPSYAITAPVMNPQGDSMAQRMLSDLMNEKQEKSEGMDEEQLANLAKMFGSYFGGG